ncbi:uncharacterized protein LOC116953889 isoform X1 [Petromyzon marinus]|uniref:Uncharacterized protein LOC116953889 isoform X1 n=1 Tax=Petromyzon marinus TaxID=7757 RepID=A0AAJ7U575_PETMA|nr:uncharacterized protein LOC116953889 isoform X1 [Petromyzon marinus]XP_032830069.1 uncharacterized protein LOC116953889 isoform X1 [Petromyzon marinus]
MANVGAMRAEQRGKLAPEDARSLGKSPVYGVRWLDACLQETLLPGASWHKISTEVSSEALDTRKRSPGQEHHGQRSPNEDSVAAFVDGTRVAVAAAARRAMAQEAARQGELARRSVGLQGSRSELLGESMCAVLGVGPECLDRVCSRLTGKLLPAQLRREIWCRSLGGACEGEAWEQFRRKVWRGVDQMGMTHATQSPVAHLIRNTVTEKLRGSGWLQRTYISGDGLAFTLVCDVLNVLYTHGRVYAPHLVYRLVPLHLAFASGHPHAEATLQLAFHLNALLQKHFPEWRRIADIAQKVVARLQEGDPHLHARLLRLTRDVGAPHTQKEFRSLLEWGDDEEKQKENHPHTGDGERGDSGGDAVERRDPHGPLPSILLVLRKWIGEAFVSVLSAPAVLLLWDQLFLSAWDERVFVDSCLALLLLLRDQIMACADWSSLIQVLLEETQRLYTVDVARALAHLRGDGAALAVPVLNRWHGALSPWVAHDPSVAPPTPCRPSEPFVLHIDAVRYLPDCATIIKVTGRVVKSGLEGLEDIMAVPELDSLARSPHFSERVPVPAGSDARVHDDALLLLRVYTLERDSRRAVVIGNVLFRLFRSDGCLKSGGHQLRLWAGMPDPGDSAPLNEHSLVHHPLVPACTILIRLLPLTLEPRPRPSYETGFYLTEGARPSPSEINIIGSYSRDDAGSPRTVRDWLSVLHPGELPTDWRSIYLELLDARRALPPGCPAPHLSPLRAVRYRQRTGVCVSVTDASVTSRGCPYHYVRVLANILPGAELDTRADEVRDAVKEIVIASRLNLVNCGTLSGELENCKILNLQPDRANSLLLRVFGRHDDDGENSEFADVSGADSKGSSSSPQLGWGVLPLFHGPYVRTGKHHILLFEGAPDENVAALLTRGGDVASALREAEEKQWTRRAKLCTGLTMELWDGHYLESERESLMNWASKYQAEHGEERP